MRFALTYRLGLAALLSLPIIASAKYETCERYLGSSPPLTLKSLRERARSRIEAHERIVAQPGFDNIEVETAQEQVGERGPRAMQDFLSTGVSFVATPAPTTSDISLVSTAKEFRSVPLHVDVDWQDERTSTTVYASLPHAKIQSAGSYTVSNEYPVVLVSLHGGGTPSASGKNGMNIGQNLAEKGVPVIAMDLPGHGRATRKLNGFLEFKQQIDWMLQVIDQVVHPSVKVDIVGHSWGAMYLVYLHRLTADPKYARLRKLYALAPGIDVALGGGPLKQQEFGESFRARFKEFKDNIAESDIEFEENFIANGKNADIPGLFTMLAGLDYNLPKLTPEQQKDLKPLKVRVGRNDGVVYVGREEPYDEYFSALVAPSSYEVIGAGLSWKSKKSDDVKATGHNVFDRYVDGTWAIQNGETTGVYETYKWLADEVLEGIGETIPQASELDEAEEAMEKAFRHYANSLAFREIVDSHVEFIRRPTENLKDITNRRNELAVYVQQIQKRQEGIKEDLVKAIQKANDSLRAELGIVDAVTLERAQEILATPPLTEERRAQLEGYVAAASSIEKRLSEEFKDLDYQATVDRLDKEFAGLRERLNIKSVTDYRQHYDQLRNKKDVSPQEKKDRTEVSTLHNKMLEAFKKKQERFGVELRRQLEKLAKPEGVVDARAARRELKVERSPEHLAKLAEFVIRWPGVEAEARSRVEAELQLAIALIPKPKGVETAEQGIYAKRDIDNLMASTFAPADPEIAAVAHRIAELEEERERVAQGDVGQAKLKELSDSFKKTKSRLKNANGKWDAIWKWNESEENKNPKLTSEILEQQKKIYADALENYTSAWFAYDDKRSRWLIDLKASDQLTAANIVNMTPVLKAMRHKMQVARQAFLREKAQLEKTRWLEVLSGRMTGPEDVLAEVKRLANEVWGEEYALTGNPGMTSLVHLLKVEEEYLESRLVRSSEIEKELNTLRFRYTQMMTERNMAVPYAYETVSLMDFFNQPLDKAVQQLRNDRLLLDAINNTIVTWENMLSELRRQEDSTKDAGY